MVDQIVLYTVGHNDHYQSITIVIHNFRTRSPDGKFHQKFHKHPLGHLLSESGVKQRDPFGPLSGPGFELTDFCNMKIRS